VSRLKWVPTSFDAGNIILGGEGSDIIAGQGGDDLIDGDAWLNVRISVRAGFDANGPFGPEITSVDSMVPLIPFMLNGTYNPGQLQIVRELLYSPTQDFDTALFRGPLADYSFTVNGVAANVAQVVAATANDLITVTDNNAAGIPDGTDTLRHIERLQFADQALVIDGLNHAPAGLLTISDPTPTEDQLLTVSIAGVTDADNVSPTNPTGAIPEPVSYFWQGELTPGVFQDIEYFGAGESQRAVGTSFTPTEPFVGGINFASLTGVALRVRAVYQDGHGVLEEVFSAPTAPVANVNDAPTGLPTISDPTPTEGRQLTESTLGIADADGLTTAVFAFQWQQANVTGVGGGTAGFSDITIAGVPVTTQTFTPTQAQVNRELRVVVTYTDDHGTLETLNSAATTVTGDFIPANAAAQTLTGTEGSDIILGGGGADTLNGLGGDDLLDGGAGNDVINAGAGNDTLIGGPGNDTLNGESGDDTFLYTIGDGVDMVNGGADSDTLNITGRANVDDTLNVTFDGTRLIAFGGGANNIANVELVTADLLTSAPPPVGLGDTLNYAAASAAVRVNLATGTASGFPLGIKNIENVSGGNGADVLTGNDGNDTFVLHVGEADGDTVVDFAGNGTGVEDSLQFVGYGAGATFTNIDATHWQVNYNSGASHDVITFLNGAPIDPTDFSFA